MMRISLQGVTLQGFRSFAKRSQVQFDDCRGLFLLTGRNEAEPLIGANGTGKSSIWGAVCWALFGVYPNGLRSSSLAAWGSEEKMSVSVSLQLDGEGYEVVRTWRPNSLLRNGEAVTQDILENELQSTVKQFLQQVYMAQNVKMFLDHSHTDRATFISNLLCLGVWDEAREAATKSARKMQLAATQCEKDIARVTGEVAVLESTSLEGYAEQFEQDRKRAIARIDATCAANEERIKELRAGIRRRTSRVALEQSMESARDRLGKALRSESLYRDRLSEVSNALHKIRRDKGKCPTCGTQLDTEHRREVERSIREQQDPLREKILKYETEAKSANESLAELRSPWLKAEEARTKQARIEELRSQIEKDLLARQHLEQKTNPARDQDRARKRRLSKAKELRVHHREARESLLRSQDIAEFWAKGFSQIRFLQVGQVMKRLENECAANLTALGLPEWHIEFKLDKENKSGTVHRGFHALIHSPRNASPVPFEAWSGGEAQRLRLAVGMGVADMVQDFSASVWDVEVWDEPAAWLSQDGIDHLLSALKERAKRSSKAVWLVDHRALHSGEFDGVLCAVKSSEGSQTQWEE